MRLRRRGEKLEPTAKDPAKRAAGATKPDQATIKGKIVEFVWHLKKQGYSEQTIKTYMANLERLLKRGANLLDGESVKDVIAQQESWSTTTKHVAVTSYAAFTTFNGIAWSPPSYKPQTKLPFIPLESEIDALIASADKRLSTILQLLKETAMRIGEACKLKWIDIDLANNVVTVNNPEKTVIHECSEFRASLQPCSTHYPKQRITCLEKPMPEMPQQT
ncbi:MAG: tyrosine-type recombinase/integrase [Candidatus Bathyarchaeia archaeon]